MTRSSHEGPDLEALLAKIADQYGPDVTIVDTKRTRNKGVMGLFAKTHYKLTIDAAQPVGHGERKGDNMPKFQGLSSNSTDAPPHQEGGKTGITTSPSHSTLTRLIEAAEAKERREDHVQLPHESPRDSQDQGQCATVRQSDEEEQLAVDPLFAHLLGDAMRREGLHIPTNPDVVDVSDNATFARSHSNDTTTSAVPEQQSSQEKQENTALRPGDDQDNNHDFAVRLPKANAKYGEYAQSSKPAHTEPQPGVKSEDAAKLQEMAEYDEEVHDEDLEVDNILEAEQGEASDSAQEVSSLSYTNNLPTNAAPQQPALPSLQPPAPPIRPSTNNRTTQLPSTPQAPLSTFRVTKPKPTPAGPPREVISPPAPPKVITQSAPREVISPPAPPRGGHQYIARGDQATATPGGKLNSHLHRRGMPQHLLANLPAEAGVEDLMTLLTHLPAPPPMTGDVGTVVAVTSFGPVSNILAEDIAIELAGGDVPVAPTAMCRDEASAKVAAKNVRRSASLGVLTVTHRGRASDGATTASIIEAAKPEFVIAVVDARFKHLDTATWINSMAAAGLAIDALCLEGAFDTSEPATALELQPPIWRINGSRADSLSWLPLLLADYDR